MKRTISVLALTMILPACYHATVETGLVPGPQTLEQKWASGWIYGLVPPATVEAMQRCPNGVARVETKLSFLNQLVSGLTLGIYTPMEIVVTCATGGRGDASVDNAEDFVRALESGEPFVVQVGL